MMTSALPVEGSWRVMHVEAGFGLRRGFAAKPFDERWVSAVVPGMVHLDYMAAGLIADPFVGLNADQCRWMEEMDYWYETTVEAPTVAADQRLWLLFDGLDTLATVYLNGEEIGSHANMFTPLRLDVTDRVRDGANQLLVRLAAPAFPPGRDLSTEGVVGAFNRTRLHIRKIQASYSWNIAPRLVTTGIWKPVRWLITSDAWICDAALLTIAVHPDGGADLQARIGVAGEPRDDVYALVDAFGEQRRGELVGDEIVVDWHQPEVDLWWPRGHGRQPLHPWQVVLRSGDVTLDERHGRVGVRAVAVRQQPDPDGGTSFQVRVNGKPIFLKGMNWTPADAIPVRVGAARYDLLLEAAVEANVNALRVWGGGLYEDDCFYRRCDELGILLTHDFMFACGAYPQDPDFLDAVWQEAVYQVRRLRSFASVALWFGDNENDVVTPGMGRPDYRRRSPLSKEVLAAAVAAHAPTTPYFPSSPFSPRVDDQNDPTEGDCHIWGHGKAYDDPFYADQRPRMVTEIGYLGFPDRAVIDAFLSPEGPRWPVWHEEYLTHGADSQRRDLDGRYRHVFGNIAELGLPEPTDLDDLITVSQQTQADATAYWIHHYGSQPTCWGIFLWNLADCWPQMSDAYIAYPFHPKPALEAVRDGYGANTR